MSQLDVGFWCLGMTDREWTGTRAVGELDHVYSRDLLSVLSQQMETVVLGIGSFSSRRVVVDPRSVQSLSLPSCDAASALYDGSAVTDSMRERASATTLFCLEMRDKVKIVELTR
jgi:hypothetical protein